MTTFASYDGTLLHYDEVGEGDPLICLPGGPGRAAVYFEDLGGLPRKLVRFDPRAVGRSEVPSDPSTLRFDRQAADVEALREHLGLEQLDLLGHSAGTVVAQCWAAQHPTSVRSLVLLTPSGVLQGHDRTAEVAALRAEREGEPWWADATAAAEAMDDAPPSQRGALERAMRPFLYGRWDERCQAHAATADSQSSKRALQGFAQGVQEVDIPALVARLRDVTAPVLVVAGERDALTGIEAADVVARSFPNARAVVVPGAGHLPWVDEPDSLVAALTPFLVGNEQDPLAQ